MSDIVDRLRSRTAGMGVRCAEDYGTTLSVADVVEAADEIERLRDKLAWWNEQSHEMLDAVEKAEAERDRLREALKWFIDNDETNEGDAPLPEYGGRSWNEINAYWIDGLTRARAVLKGTGHD